jgi:hypothetical protein
VTPATAETPLDRAFRLMIESHCASVFRVIEDALPRPVELTFVVFDYGDGGNVAFATTLTRPEFHDVLRGALRRWATGIGVADQGAELLNGTELEALYRVARTALPEAFGFALLVGRGDMTVYIASAARDGVAGTFEDLLVAEARQGSN